MTRIGIITSSTRPTRIGPKVAAWVAASAPEGVEVDLVDLGELALPFLGDAEMPAKGEYDLPSTKAWAERVDGFDAIVFVVAQYNSSYAAPLKNAIDTLYREWNGKPVGLVGYGWGGAAAAMDHIGAVLRHVKTDLVADVRPQLFFNTTMTPAGEILADAPADDVRELFRVLVEAADEDEAAA